MLAWVILGVCLFMSIVLLGHWFAGANPALLAKGIKCLIFGILAVVAVFFAVTGRLAFVVPLLIGGFWWLIRSSLRRALFQAAAGAARAAAGGNYGVPSED